MMSYYDLLTKTPLIGFKAGVLKNYAIGGTLEENRKIVRRRKTLVNPLSKGILSVDTALLTIAKKNNVAIGITLDQFNKQRIRLLSNYMLLVKLCKRKGVRLFLSSGKTPRTTEELIAFGEMLGMTEKQAKWSISKVPEYLLEEEK